MKLMRHLTTKMRHLSLLQPCLMTPWSRPMLLSTQQSVPCKEAKTRQPARYLLQLCTNQHQQCVFQPIADCFPQQTEPTASGPSWGRKACGQMGNEPPSHEPPTPPYPPSYPAPNLEPLKIYRTQKFPLNPTRCGRPQLSILLHSPLLLKININVCTAR